MANAPGVNYIDVVKSFIPSVEGFSAVPIWDYDQWSWGYGTAAGYNKNKKPAGTISQDKAMQELLKVVNAHYKILAPLVKKKLTANQWAALLSFSYNLGTEGGPKKIIETINAGTVADVVTRMKKYIYAGGLINQGLVNRRKKETALYQS